jgi:ComF family protein
MVRGFWPKLAASWHTLLDFFLPRPCLGCQEILPAGDPGWLCSTCQADLPLLPWPRCPRCGAPFRSPMVGEHLCQACLRQPPPFMRARAVAFYEGLILEAIHRLKYQRQLLYAKFLGDLMQQDPDIQEIIAGAELLLPVPLHPTRLRWRGFNQALLLARHLAPARLDTQVLIRQRSTRPQVGLTSQERRANVKGAFAVTDPARVAGKNLVLIDDVFTTGATINECARVLRQAKAARLEVITVARVGYA